MILSIEPKEILKSITQHKLRNALTGFGIAWGIFVLILMLGVGDSFQQGVFSELKGFASSTISLWGSETSMAHNGIYEKKEIRFDETYERILVKKFPEINYISLEANSPQSLQMSYEDNKSEGSVNGIQEDYFNIKKLQVKDGRLFNQNDFNNDKPVCIIPEGLEKVLFKRKKKAIGEYINVGGNFFLVVGVTKSGGMFDFNDRSTITIPFNYYKTLFNIESSRGLLISLKPEASDPKFMDDIRVHNSKYFNINPLDMEAYYLNSLSEGVKEIQGVFTGLKVFIWFVGFCILITGIISVGNIMYVNINERTREIGIRKAIGATPRNILDMILAESILLTSIAGIVGMVVGFIFIQIIKAVIAQIASDNQFLANIGINFQIVLGSFILLVIAGVVAGILPAIKASKIKPVLALNQEN